MHRIGMDWSKQAYCNVPRTSRVRAGVLCRAGQTGSGTVDWKSEERKWLTPDGAFACLHTRRPVRLDEIARQHRVIYFGENHSCTRIPQFFAQWMPELARLGITHLGLELFGCSRRTQCLLDIYAQDRDGPAREAIVQYLVKHYSDDPNWLHSHMIPLDAAVKAGIRLVGLDASSRFYWVRIMRGLRKILGERFYKRFHDFYLAKVRPLDNRTWAKVIAKILRQPKYRIAVWAGALHTSYEPWRGKLTVNMVVQSNAHVTGPVVHFFGGNGGNDMARARGYLTQAAIELNLADQVFMLDSGPLDSSNLGMRKWIPGADYFIHVPK